MFQPVNSRNRCFTDSLRLYELIVSSSNEVRLDASVFDHTRQQWKRGLILVEFAMFKEMLLDMGSKGEPLLELLCELLPGIGEASERIDVETLYGRGLLFSCGLFCVEKITMAAAYRQLRSMARKTGEQMPPKEDLIPSVTEDGADIWFFNLLCYIGHATIMQMPEPPRLPGGMQKRFMQFAGSMKDLEFRYRFYESLCKDGWRSKRARGFCGLREEPVFAMVSGLFGGDQGQGEN